MSKNFKPLVIVSGDPDSVFLELFFKIFIREKFKKPLILIVNREILENQMKILNYNIKIQEIFLSSLNLHKIDNKKINFINVPFKKNLIKYLELSFNIGLNIVNKDKNISLINGPINKTRFLNNKHLGITEYLGKKYKKQNEVVMLIYNNNLSVSPLTTHIPLKKVHLYISKKRIINHVKKINSFYKLKFNKKPKIGLTGLNPHCESNFKSSEEKNIIIPAIKFLKSQKFRVFGPFSADTIFLKENYKKFDVIIGMYHDQVLAPIKSIFNFNAINITLGLPFLRVSPDHGPNVKMFGKNVSNPTSLREAIKFLDSK